MCFLKTEKKLQIPLYFTIADHTYLFSKKVPKINIHNIVIANLPKRFN